MTGKQRILKTLRFEEPDYPPHFEIMFELVQEAFGQEFPTPQEWQHACTATEKAKLVGRCMELYQKIVSRYQWDALAVFFPWSDPDGVVAAKKVFGEEILIGSIVGDTIWSIENIKDWMEFSVTLMDQPEEIHRTANLKTEVAIETFKKLIDAGADFIHLVNDVAFNAGPMVSFQSVDPMAGLDIAKTKERCHGKMALMGIVQCNLLQDGPDEVIRKSALYCLENASPGGGYIFGTSNTIFKGMPLENYEYMLQVYRDFCRSQCRAAKE